MFLYETLAFFRQTGRSSPRSKLHKLWPPRPTACVALRVWQFRGFVNQSSTSMSRPLIHVIIHIVIYIVIHIVIHIIFRIFPDCCTCGVCASEFLQDILLNMGHTRSDTYTCTYMSCVRNITNNWTMTPHSYYTILYYIPTHLTQLIHLQSSEIFLPNRSSTSPPIETATTLTGVVLVGFTFQQRVSRSE